MRLFIFHERRKLVLSTLVLIALSSLNAFAQAPAEPAQKTYIEGATLWQQTSGERRALSYQAFNLARMMLDRDLRIHRRDHKQRAIVVDCDETILDNSRFEGKEVTAHMNYNQKDWTDWINRVEAEAVPGAVEFLRYASAHGVRVFYITNRYPNQKAATAANLKKLGFPEVNDETLLIQTDLSDSSKEGRRRDVGSRYRIVLLMGDDLNDFAAVFEKSLTIADRMAAADRYRQEFGKRFIMLPNAMYGNWESAMYDYNFKLTEAQKIEKRRSLLKDY